MLLGSSLALGPTSSSGGADLLRSLFNRAGVAIAGRDGTLVQSGATGSTALHPTTGAVASAGDLISHNLVLGGVGVLPMSFAQGARTNLLLNSVWSGAVGGSPGTAPTSWGITTTGAPSTAVSGGTITFTVDGATARAFYTQTVSVSASTVYTLSVRIASLSNALAVSEVVLWNTFPAGASTTYSINGVSVANSVAVSAGDVVCTHLTVAATPGTAIARVGAQTGGSLFVATVMALKSPQVESGSFRGLYIPTTSASLTRTADNILWTPPAALSTTSGEVVAIAAPYLWSAGAGAAGPHAAAPRLFGLGSPAGGELSRDTVDSASHVDGGGTQLASAATLAASSGVLSRWSMKFESTALRLYQNGALAASDATVTNPWVASTTLSVGDRAAYSRPWHGFVGLIYVPGGLTDAERSALARLTTGSLNYVG
jgi:hypothetical protein